MKQQSASLKTICCLLVISSLSIQATAGHLTRFKRQTLGDRLGSAASGAVSGFTGANSNRREPTIKLEGSLNKPTSDQSSSNPLPVGSGSTSLDDSFFEPSEIDEKKPAGSLTNGADKLTSPESGNSNPNRRPTKPLRPKPRPQVSSTATIAASADNEDDEYENDERPSSHWGRNDRFSDYRGIVRMAMGPMRHMKGMLARMMDEMPSSEGGDEYYELGGGDGDGGQDIAIASSFSNGDGYSRSSSAISNNGRTRGIISETRNGRTRTRRIGSDSDEADEGEEYYS